MEYLKGINFQAILPLIFFAFRMKVSEPLLTVCPSHSPGDGLSGCWYLEVPTQRSLPSGSVQITDNTADTGDFPLSQLAGPTPTLFNSPSYQQQLVPHPFPTSPSKHSGFMLTPISSSFDTMPCVDLLNSWFLLSIFNPPYFSHISSHGLLF